MTDLEKLIEAVEAGGWPDRQTEVGAFYRGGSIAHCNECARLARSANKGSLGAANRLHDALLSGMFWNMGHLDQPSLGYVCTIADGHFADSQSWRGYAITPARAWLLAILRALQAKGDA